ncbi:hypothetical protein GGX14DRAFT_394034 [Mycena pura]|uniref:Uncharacterized protein n=1 Tax=Mycena pura TaxID=153505 RepID=A0AAD6VHN1_9AGAR|nr:hypothetical protein GGX14DRAFT_394034 [Mycena pura]
MESGQIQLANTNFCLDLTNDDLTKGQHFREKRNRTRFFNLAEGRGTNQLRKHPYKGMSRVHVIAFSRQTKLMLHPSLAILTMPGTGWGHSQIFFAEYTTLSQRVWTQIMAALQRFAQPAPDERYALQDSNFSEQPKKMFLVTLTLCRPKHNITRFSSMNLSELEVAGSSGSGSNMPGPGPALTVRQPLGPHQPQHSSNLDLYGWEHQPDLED